MVNHPNRGRRFIDDLSTLCKFVDTRRKTPRAGRGAGFREGNQQRGRLIQHIKTEHPEAYAEALESHRARAAALKESRDRNRGLSVFEILSRDADR